MHSTTQYSTKNKFQVHNNYIQSQLSHIIPQAPNTKITERHYI